MHYCTIFIYIYIYYLHNVELEKKINHQACFPDAYLACNQLISVNVKEEGKWFCGLQLLRSRDMRYFIVTEKIETLCLLLEIAHT